MFAKSNGEHLFRFKRLGGEGKQSKNKNELRIFSKALIMEKGVGITLTTLSI